MKRAILLPAILLFAVAGCGEHKSPADGLITVDVTTSYPQKELILQDFTDVEYIPLETTDTFLCRGFVQAVGRNIIIVRNSMNDGDIFLFDRTGKGLRKINRMGQGGEEYTSIGAIVADEDRSELFVSDPAANAVKVYTMDGTYLRSFKQKEGATYRNMYNFDREHLICRDGSYRSEEAEHKPPFLIVSKQDGSIAGEIDIPFEKHKTAMMMQVDEASGAVHVSTPSTDYPIVPSSGRWILVELSSDTLYRYAPDRRMTPFIIRTPSIQSMDPEIFLFIHVLTDRYCLMEAVKKEYDFTAYRGFPRTRLMYDRQENTLFQYTVYNADYEDKEEVPMTSKPLSDEIAFWQSLEAPDLTEALEQGRLKGRLKEIASTLNEESNPVILLAKQKQQ